jgi:methylmalonyl-CoA mutase N-terminal domain/subunit
VPISHLGDMERLFDGIPLAQMNTSMTINATAPWLLALYIALAERQGADAQARSPARCRTTSSRSTSRAAPTSSRRSPRCG